MNIENYSKKIFGFALSKTGNIQNAEDLSQEILMAVYNSKEKFHEIENMDAYIYRIARYTWSNYLRREKKNWRNVSFDMEKHGESQDTIEKEHRKKEKKEKILNMKRELAFMSRTYREIMIKKYFEGKKIKEISEELLMSEGTVKWYIYDAKKKLKENIMKTYKSEESEFYQPKRMEIFYSGTPGIKDEPRSYFRGLLTQNIAIAAYKKPVTIEELGRRLNVALVYIEEEIKILLDAGLVKRTGEKYQTVFIVDDYRSRAERLKVIKECSDKISDEVYKIFVSKKQKITSLLENGSHFDYEYLLWALIPYCLDEAIMRSDYHKTLEEFNHTERVDGGKYTVFGQVIEEKENLSWEEKELVERLTMEGIKTREKVGVCSSYQMDFYYSGNQWREFNIEEVVQILRIVDAQKKDEELSTVEKAVAAEMIEMGYLQMRENRITSAVPIIKESIIEEITEEIMEQFDRSGVMEEIENMISKYHLLIKKGSPKSVRENDIGVSAKFGTTVLSAACLDTMVQENILRKPHEEELKSLTTIIKVM